MKKNIIIRSLIAVTITGLLITSVPSFSSQQHHTNNTHSTIMMETKAWTSFYYIDVDWKSFNVDVLETKFIDKIASGENLNVLVLQDKEKDPAFLYYIDEQHNKILLEELGEVNMADPQTLTNFLTFGKEYYPSERYQLCIWSHANAWYGLCLDETSGGDIMTIDEFQQALTPTNGVDLLCFIGCCQMGSLEAVYELRNLCEVYVGSEDDGYGPHWYGMLDEMCRLLNNDTLMSTNDYGKQIVQLIGDNPNEFEQELTISAMRTERVTELVDAIEDLSIHLYENDDELYENLKSARYLTKEYEFIQDSYLLDIFDFADNYLAIETNQTIRGILSSIQTNVSETVIAECHGDMQHGSHGLSIFYSSKDLISLYIEYGLDFTRDTHWDELLDTHKEKSNPLLFTDLIYHLIEKHPQLFPLIKRILGV